MEVMSSENRKDSECFNETKRENLQALCEEKLYSNTRRIWCVGRRTVGADKKKRGEIVKWYSARASNEDLTTRKMTKKC